MTRTPGVVVALAVVSLARDRRVSTAFGRICYCPLGQTPDIADLQRSLHQQLCDQPMPAEAGSSHAAMAPALRVRPAPAVASVESHFKEHLKRLGTFFKSNAKIFRAFKSV